MWLKKYGHLWEVPRHLILYIVCLLLVSVTATKNYGQVAGNGLVGYYTFCDCTARDISGNNRHGTIFGTPQCVQGKRDKGLLLNQVNRTNSCGQRGGEYIQLPTLGAIWSEGFTVCAWVRFDNQSYFERIIDFGNNTGEAGGLPIWFGREGNTNTLTLESWINLSGNQARGTGRLSAPNAITNGSIEYYCATIHEDTMRIYVDGVLRAERKGNPIANVARSRNYIGHSNWCANDPDFKGFLDEVRIYNRALSAAEIQNLFLVTNVNDFAANSSCNSLSVDFSIPNTNNIDSLKWTFGDAASGSANQASGQSVSHVFSAPGSYNVSLVAYKACLNDTVRKTVNVHEVPAAYLGNDLDWCPGSGSSLQVASIPRASYLWQNGNTTNSLPVTDAGLYWLQVSVDGCVYRDSVTVTSLQKTSSLSNIICDGATYLGYNQTGIYTDTFPLSNGCDSIRTLDLSVKQKMVFRLDTSICQGQNYMGYNSSGRYADTLRYASGCDSLIRIVDLLVQQPVSTTSNVIICEGSLYTLPSGKQVSRAGLYSDTLYFATGCDSMISTVNLMVQAPVPVKNTVTICQGERFTLPAGNQVSLAGIYRDTLYYTSGCDSLIREVTVNVQPVAFVETSASICSGTSYTLPWNLVVSTAGIYKDTIRYPSGCDSLIRQVMLQVIQPAQNIADTSICEGAGLLLPWGLTVSAAGYYLDTLRASGGCDSLVRGIRVSVNPSPAITVVKSNDIDCVLGVAKLSVSGAASDAIFSWEPAATLNDPASANPVASPDSTTAYKVQVTTAGCAAEGSILLSVSNLDPENGFLVPNAFTPNRDGKNDCFGVAYWGVVEDFSFMIYNRWGQLLFHTNNIQDCWDGTQKGMPVGNGLYVYLIRANTRCGPVERRGFVTLIR